MKKRFTVIFIFLRAIALATAGTALLALSVSAHIPAPESTWRTQPPAVERDVCFESDLGVKYPSMSLTTADWIRLRTPLRYPQKVHVPGMGVRWVICQNNPINRIDPDGRKDLSGNSYLVVIDILQDSDIEKAVIEAANRLGIEPYYIKAPHLDKYEARHSVFMSNPNDLLFVVGHSTNEKDAVQVSGGIISGGKGYWSKEMLNDLAAKPGSFYFFGGFSCSSIDYALEISNKDN